MSNPDPITPIDPDAWYAARKSEFADALPSAGIDGDISVKGLAALFEADLRRLAPDPQAELSVSIAQWFHKNRLDFVRSQVIAELEGDTAGHGDAR